jgi:Family of unknown function (DUF6314)
VSASGQEGWPLRGGTLDYLRGNWQADRTLTDFLLDRAGAFEGQAAFADPPAEAGLRAGALAFREAGELRFGAHRGPASRSLLFLPEPDGSAEVLFADGRPFYRLDLRAGCWQAEHPCRADQYLVTVRVLSPDCFTEHWRVTGPATDYAMTTTLTRIGPPG